MLSFSFRLLHRQVEELVEGLQGFGRVRCPGQGMGELLDEDGRQTQLLLIGCVGELLPVAVADIKAIVNLAVFHIELCFGDIDVAHREGVGEGIQEGRCVVRPDVHNSIDGRLAVVERDLYRVQQTAEGPTSFAQLFDQPPIDCEPCLFKLSRIEQCDH